MPQVDAWVVEHSLAMLARLRRDRPRVRARGQPVRALHRQPRHRAAIRESLRAPRRRPAALILEITETAAVADVALARAFAERMTELGCAFALDDFGAGFGSFYYLKHLIFDYVKIDGEFVAHVHESAGRPHDHALDRRHRPRPGQADGGGVRLRRRRSSRCAGPRASTSRRATSSASRCPSRTSSTGSCGPRCWRRPGATSAPLPAHAT